MKLLRRTDEIRMEPNACYNKPTIQLRKLYYTINESPSPILCIVNGILVLEDATVEVSADDRGEDTAVGF